MMIRLLAGAMAPGALLFVATAAAAAPAPAPVDPFSIDVRQMRVSYADLDLSQPAAQREMARRVSRAVAQVCGTDIGGIGW
ncbi:UrcA family protein, partial [Acinetobacter baumannii]